MACKGLPTRPRTVAVEVVKAVTLLGLWAVVSRPGL